MGTIVGVGQVTVNADQAAGGNYQAGSASSSFTAAQAPTKTSLSGSINSTPASTATLTATVSPTNTGTYAAAPTGMVSFYDGGTLIGTASVIAGKASLVTATYTSTNYAASPTSNSLPLTFSVAPAITFTTAASYAYGRSFQLAASSNSTGTFTYSLVSGPAKHGQPEHRCDRGEPAGSRDPAYLPSVVACFPGRRLTSERQVCAHRYGDYL